MTVSVQQPFTEYTAAPGATLFAYTFKVAAAADMQVTIDNGEPLQLGVDYTITGVGEQQGDVTLLTPLIGGEYVLLRRSMQYDRATDYQQNGDFLSPTVNNDFDRLWLALQQFGQDLLRSFKLPFNTTTTQELAESPLQRANKALVFDADGNIAVSEDDYNDQAAAAAASATAAQNSSNSAAGFAEDANADRIAAEQAAEDAAESAASINPANLIHTTGDETMAGTKTFLDSPTVPTATTSDQAINKGQADKAYSILGASKNLVITNNAATPNSQLDVDADEIILKDSSGNAYLASAVNLTIDITATGANGRDAGSEANSTWYNAWVIYNPTTATVAGLLSTSPTAPTLPSGYTYKAWAGAIYNDGSGNFIKYYQHNKKFRIRSSIVSSSLPGTSYTSVSLAEVVPPAAKFVMGRWACDTGPSIDTDLYVSPKSSDDIADIARLFCGSSVRYQVPFLFDCPLLESQTIYVKRAGDAITTASVLTVNGGSF